MSKKGNKCDWLSAPSTYQEFLYHNPGRSFIQEETEAQRINLLLKVARKWQNQALYLAASILKSMLFSFLHNP